ncbi:MAG: V-type ATP synthase subunit E [Clostridia bacterium]|nr:V-type ATP synthase subunit E [Clostridia bacterium]
MTGLEKILDSIRADGDARGAAARAAAQKDCTRMLEEAVKRGEAQAAALTEKAQAERDSILALAQSGAAQQKRQTLLAAKVALLNETLDALLQTMLNLPTEDYFNAVIKLAAENAMAGACTARLNARDLARRPADFEAKLAAALKEKGADCALAQETVDILGGVVLVYGDIEINCAFEALVETKADALKAQIGEILF